MEEKGKWVTVHGHPVFIRENANKKAITSSDGAGGTHEPTEAEKHEMARRGIPQESSKPKQGKSKDEFFGEEFTGYKGKEAIEKLLKEKRGHIKNAFERPEIGGIDLVWGDKNGGLLHTMQKRDKLLAKGKGHITGLDMARKIPEIIEKGQFDIDEQDRIGFIYENYRVAIRPQYFNDKLNWVVTALEIFPE